MKKINHFSQFLSEGAIQIEAVSASLKANEFADILRKYVGQKEVGKNGGPLVDALLKNVGLGTGYPWCMAFVYGVFKEFAGSANPLPKTAGVVDHWSKVPVSALKITRDQAIQKPELVRAGQVFFKSRKGGGHTGIVLRLEGKSFITIDGNSNDGVKINRYQLDSTALLGFADYFQNPEFSAALDLAASSLIGSQPNAISSGGKET